MIEKADNRATEQNEFDEWVKEQRLWRKQKIEKIKSEASAVFAIVGIIVLLLLFSNGGGLTVSALVGALVGWMASAWFKSREIDKLGTGP